jgi:hypothetical protein
VLTARRQAANCHLLSLCARSLYSQFITNQHASYYTQQTIGRKNRFNGKKTGGKLSLIDLAGSEKAAKTGAEAGSDMAKEGVSINLSLNDLMKVISSIKEIQVRTATVGVNFFVFVVLMRSVYHSISRLFIAQFIFILYRRRVTRKVIRARR